MDLLIKIKVVELNENHLESASELFTKYYKEVRQKLNILPERYEENIATKEVDG